MRKYNRQGHPKIPKTSEISLNYPIIIPHSFSSYPINSPLVLVPDIPKIILLIYHIFSCLKNKSTS